MGSHSRQQKDVFVLARFCRLLSGAVIFANAFGIMSQDMFSFPCAQAM